jgi:hypothetical protein
MDTININTEMNKMNEMNIDYIQFQKMTFLYNALNEGWSIKKDGNKYIFTKKHENKKEIFDESYLLQFMKSNFDMSKL